MSRYCLHNTVGLGLRADKLPTCSLLAENDVLMTADGRAYKDLSQIRPASSFILISPLLL